MKTYQINSLAAMQEFFEDVINLYDCTLMPDDLFTDMVNTETGEAPFTEEEAVYLDSVMTECFNYCDANGLDIYREAGVIQVREYKRRGLLPQNFPNP